MNSTACHIFILHDLGDNITQLAQAIADGVTSVPGVTVKISQPNHATKADLLEPTVSLSVRQTGRGSKARSNAGSTPPAICGKRVAWPGK
jgi:hypothetical protein